jgi:D-arabinose 1-dehydrogenase-like Zn-dependent alcohol dehydrogenase
MARMNAAVVTSFAEPPHYQQFEVPRPDGADEALVDVLAVGLHPRVRSGAAGAHYTSPGTLPMIPGSTPWAGAPTASGSISWPPTTPTPRRSPPR